MEKEKIGILLFSPVLYDYFQKLQYCLATVLHSKVKAQAFVKTETVN